MTSENNPMRINVLQNDPNDPSHIIETFVCTITADGTIVFEPGIVPGTDLYDKTVNQLRLMGISQEQINGGQL